MITSAKALLEKYVEGKDLDKHEILEEIYLSSARVLFRIESGNISFPSEIIGNREIAKTLSADFNKKYDNIKTYYISCDFSKMDNLMISDQPWLVVMREIENDTIRIGTGYYDWEFSRHTSDGLKISKHIIKIGVMLSLPGVWLSLLKELQGRLSYPWVDRIQVMEILAGSPQLFEVSNYLAGN